MQVLKGTVLCGKQGCVYHRLLLHLGAVGKQFVEKTHRVLELQDEDEDRGGGVGASVSGSRRRS